MMRKMTKKRTMRPKKENLQTQQIFRENMNQKANQTQKLLTIEMTGIMIKRLRMIRPVRWKKRNQYLHF